MGVKKLPRMNYLSVEYAEVLAAKKQTYAECRQAKNDAQELLIAQQNVVSLYDAEHTRRMSRNAGKMSKVIKFWQIKRSE